MPHTPNPDTHCLTCGEPLSEYGHCWQHHYPPMDPAQDTKPQPTASYMQTPFLTQPNTSTPVTRPQTLGTVHCINIARLGQPVALRWYGASALCGASGQAHTTQRQAEQDIQDWASGKPVGYQQHAVVPLPDTARLAPVFAAGVAAQQRRGRVPYALVGLALLSTTLYLVGRLVPTS